MTTEPLRTDDQDAAQPEGERTSRTLRGTSSGLGAGGEGKGAASQLIDLVRQATDAVRTSAEQQMPAVERAAQELSERAKRAADVAAPHVDKLAHEAASFVRDHQDELKAASVRAARIAARLTVPAALRDAVEEELARDRKRAPDGAGESAEKPAPTPPTQ
jgi:hypothetical protein